jgi:two-component system response regulator LytT
MTLRVMIAEDEKLAREEFEYMLKEKEGVVLCPSAINGKELLELYTKYLPNVVFLDIHMPELEGMSVAKQLSTLENPPLVVFTTAYDEYAVKAFEVDAVDYLLKPFSDDRLEEAIQRVRKELLLRSGGEGNQKESEKERPPAITTTRLSKLLLDDGERLIVIDPKSIYYMMREDRVIKIYTVDSMYQSKLTLNELEDKLAPLDFFRCHRGFLVNLHYVKEILPWFNGAYNIILNNKEKTKIPVSRSSVKDLLNTLQM